MQVWQTPFLSDAYAAAPAGGHRPAGADRQRRARARHLRRLSVARMVDEMSPSVPVFEALIAACARVLDHYHWLGEPSWATCARRWPRSGPRPSRSSTSSRRSRRSPRRPRGAGRAPRPNAALLRRARGEAPAHRRDWVTPARRPAPGAGAAWSTLRELRYVDLARIDELGAQTRRRSSTPPRGARSTSSQREDAFAGYQREVERLVADADADRDRRRGRAARRAARQAARAGDPHRGGRHADIADATVRTAILERIGEVLGGVNRARATLARGAASWPAARAGPSSRAEFALLGQAVTGALALADTPERCDEQLGRLLLQLEELETPLRRVRRVPAAARRQARGGLRGVRRRASRRCSTSAPAAPSGWPTRPSAILASVAAPRRDAGVAATRSTPTSPSDPMVVKLRERGGELRGARRHGARRGARRPAQGRPPGGGRALRDRLDLFGRRRRRSGSAGTASRSTPSRSS